MTPKEYPILYQTPMIQAILNGTKNQTRRIVLPRQSNPKIPPLTIEPWIVNGLRQYDDNGCPCWIGSHPDYPTKDKWFSCPYGQVGDYTWARETWQKLQTWEENGCQFYDLADKSLSYFFEYKATNESNWDGKWKPSIFMPRSACRIIRENIDIRVERVADISEEDAIGEGIYNVGKDIGYKQPLWLDYLEKGGDQGGSYLGFKDPITSYKSIWNSINNEPKFNKKLDSYIVYPFDAQSNKWSNTYRNKPLIVVVNPWVWVVKFK